MSTATATRERPILFSGPMVRAILDGRKSQTRRIIKPQPVRKPSGGFRWERADGHIIPNGPRFAGGGSKVSITDLIGEYCPYGQAGDLLWVRETWNVRGLCFGMKPRHMLAASKAAFQYQATDAEKWQHGWLPSIHMPRFASRLTLEITGVRVERVQAISEADMLAEGVQYPVSESGHPMLRLTGKCPPCHYHRKINISKGETLTDFELLQCHFASLWDTVNGEVAWDRNDWCWVIEFRRLP